jgi:hypothetical protein
LFLRRPGFLLTNELYRLRKILVWYQGTTLWSGRKRLRIMKPLPLLPDPEFYRSPAVRPANKKAHLKMGAPSVAGALTSTFPRRENVDV